jgi:hypothetical protein
MLHRQEGESLVVISQPAHAWVSGQLADAWGDASAGFAAPSAEVRVAAHQHDIGWLDWEAQPTLNPETQLPYAFNQLPTLQHLGVWSTSTPRALAYGYLPATLISMHGTYLYERFHDFNADADEEAAAAREFLRREGEFQRDALARIEALHGIGEERVRELRALISTWDAMSLALCMGATKRRGFSGVPSSNGPVEIEMMPVDDEECRFRFSPWPFRPDRLTVVCEGRGIEERFGDAVTMRAALRSAPAVRLRFDLMPA